MSEGVDPGGTSNVAAPSSLTSPPPIQPRRQQAAAIAKIMAAASSPAGRDPLRLRSDIPAMARAITKWLDTVRIATSCSAAMASSRTLAVTNAVSITLANPEIRKASFDVVLQRINLSPQE